MPIFDLTLFRRYQAARDMAKGYFKNLGGQAEGEKKADEKAKDEKAKQ